MGRFKVIVYAICKNEEKYIKTWVESMSEADDIYVLDTGSEDKSVTLLKELGVHVAVRVVKPWRFDTARNLSLAMVPEDADICVCTDFDECFHPGWRKAMEEAWEEGAKRLRYRYTWNFNPDGSEGCVFWINNVHSRHDFIWVNPVHEVLSYMPEGTYKELDAPGVQLDHHADPYKSRDQYLGLLELSVQENPDDDRNMHYLGREYLFKGMWKKCIETLEHHLKMPSATWRDERCASMRFISRAYGHLNNPALEEQWILRAIAEAPYLREPWIEASEIASRKKEWAGSLYFAERALTILTRSRTYINEAGSWGYKPYDLAAVASYYLGRYDKALRYGLKALSFAPDNKRLKQNLTFYRSSFEPHLAN